MLLINRKYKINDIKNNIYQNIILYSIFGFVLIVMINFYTIEICENQYLNNFYPTNYSENISYIIINDKEYYIDKRRRNIEDNNETIYKRFQFQYSDYPILEEIYNMHNKKVEKPPTDKSNGGINSVLYLSFRFGALPGLILFMLLFLLLH